MTSGAAWLGETPAAWMTPVIWPSAELASASGFESVDVLWRDADGVIIAAQKT